MKKKLVIILILSLVHVAMLAQGDGPRSYLLAPKGVTGVNIKWLDLDQNLIPAGTTLIPGAEIHVDVFPITLFHTFSLGGRIAQVYGMVNPGSATAKAKIGPPIGPIPVNQLSASGFSDGFVAFKVGLYGAQAMNVLAFVKSSMHFSLFGDVRLWYSGTYSADKLFNLGTNRIFFQLGLPMAIPLNKNKARATWLEVAPAVQFFGANKNPARASSASKVTQSPIFMMESHLSHNFTDKFWAVANMRVHAGGETAADGVKDDNSMRIIGGGLGVGYQVLSPLSITMDYGGVLISEKAKGKMFRVSVVFTYAKLTEIKKALPTER